MNEIINTADKETLLHMKDYYTIKLEEIQREIDSLDETHKKKPSIEDFPEILLNRVQEQVELLNDNKYGKLNFNKRFLIFLEAIVRQNHEEAERKLGFIPETEEELIEYADEITKYLMSSNQLISLLTFVKL